METTLQTATAWDVARALYAAYETRDRERAESLLSDDFTFSSPQAHDLDRAQYLERCWLDVDLIEQLRFLKVLEQGGEVFVTLELEKTDGTRMQNTEFFAVEDGQIVRLAVYLGPSLQPGAANAPPYDAHGIDLLAHELKGEAGRLVHHPFAEMKRLEGVAEEGESAVTPLLLFMGVALVLAAVAAVVMTAVFLAYYEG